MQGRLLGESRRSIQPRRRLSPSIRIERAAVKRPFAGYNLLGDGMQPGVGSLLDFRAAPHSGKRGVSVPEPFS
jgi:hypothetical protein